MNKKYALCVFLFLLTFSSIAFTELAMAKPSQAELKAALEQLLKENPNLVLNVLHENSEMVLEIAQQGNQLRKKKQLTAQWKKDAQVPKNIKTQNLPVRGATNAPVTIVAFSDYTCGYCRQSEAILELLLQKHKDTIKILFAPLPQEDDALSMFAAKYAVAAFLQDTQKGWLFHDLLFSKIQQIDDLGDSFIKQMADNLKLDFKRLKKDATSKSVENFLQETHRQALELEVAGTPQFYINDLVARGALSFEEFEEAIAIALEIAESKK